MNDSQTAATGHHLSGPLSSASPPMSSSLSAGAELGDVAWNALPSLPGSEMEVGDEH